jgi:thermitase
MLSRHRPPIIICTVLTVLLLVVGSVQAAPELQGGGTPIIDLDAPHVPGRIIVKFKPGLAPSRIARMNAAQGAKLVKEMPPQVGAKVLSVPPNELASRLTAYRANPNVEYAEPDYIAYPAHDPNDPRYADGTQWSPQKIQANLGWDLSTGDPDVVIAIIDFGVDLAHPDLQSQIWTNADEVPDNGVDDDGNGYVDDVYGWDFANDDNDPQDDRGHGTHVAGIAAAATDNANGVAGIGFNSTILAIKAGNGETGNVAYSNIAWSLYYAADNGADVINLSVGGYSNPYYLQDAVDYAWSKGCLLVGAVGNNDRSDPFYPAAYDNVIGVSATDQTDTRASWSNYGSQVSVAAPGVSIYSTYWNNGSTYNSLSGTSMAGPHVAGLAVLLFAQDATRTNADVRSLIENSADDLGSQGRDDYYGFGRVNAYQALGMTSTVLDPTAGGTLHSADGDLTLDFPPGAVPSETTVVHMLQASPSNPPSDLLFANMSCMLEATNANGDPIEQFDKPYTLTLNYQDLDWQEAGIEDENQIDLYYWNGSQWEGVAGSTLDTENNQLVVQLDHFSEFGLMGDKEGTTSVTISSFVTQDSEFELMKSVCTGVLGLLGLVGLLTAIVILKVKYPLHSSGDPRR